MHQITGEYGKNVKLMKKGRTFRISKENSIQVRPKITRYRKERLSEADIACRQVWIYNLGIVHHQQKKQSREDTNFYVWLETQSGRGCNEIVSGLFHYLSKLENTSFDEVKNELILELFLLLSKQEQHHDDSPYLFFRKEVKDSCPQTGFLEVEKEYRRREEILVPREYYEILKNHGTVNIWGQDWNTFDYKSVSQSIVKKELHFKRSETRVLTYQKRKGTVICKVRPTYTGYDIEVSSFKKGGKNANRISAQKLPAMNHVSDLKKSDVKKLLRGMDLTDKVTNFYDEVMNEPVLTVDNNADEVGQDDDSEVDV
ncbi:hypothetical protein HUJ04_005247 [Dendroctonus ponderosae]|nr:hypothetical protein HUJ04_005247 [Dendroctonus ponderosae]